MQIQPTQTTGKARGKIDYKQTLFGHMDKLLMILSSVASTPINSNVSSESEILETFRSSISHLHVLASPYNDEQYTSANEKLKIENLSPNEYTWRRFSALMRKIYRKGWLLEELSSDRIILGKEEESHIIRMIRDRLYNKNQNYVAIVVGATGTGKSYSALTLAQAVDPSFNIDRVCFSPREFLKILDGGQLKKGCALVLDEGGVSMSARAFMSFGNQALNFVLQTFRFENLFLIFTVPSLSYIDVNARGLSHAVLETKSIDRTNKTCEVKLQQVQLSPKTGKIYYPYPKKKVKDGAYNVLSRVHIGLPRAELIEQYEQKKKLFASELKKNLLAGIESNEQIRNAPKKVAPEDIVRQVEDDPAFKGRIPSIHLIAAKYNTSNDCARKAHALMSERAHVCDKTVYHSTKLNKVK